MSSYIDKAIKEAKDTNKYVIVCIEGLFGKGILSNDEAFRAISLNFVPYTTSAGSEGYKHFCDEFKIDSKENKQCYLIIDPQTYEIVAKIEKENLQQSELLMWLQNFLDKKDKSQTKNQKQHQRGQRFPKPKAKQMKSFNKMEFKLTPQTQYQEVKNITIKLVTPDGKMHTGIVNKDKKIGQWLKPKCKELGLDINNLYFLFDARQFTIDRTVKSIHLQENDVVYANYKK